VCGVHQGSRATRTVPAITLDVSRVHGARAPVEVSACDKADDDDVGAKSEARAHGSMRSGGSSQPRAPRRPPRRRFFPSRKAHSFVHETPQARIVALRISRSPGLAL